MEGGAQIWQQPWVDDFFGMVYGRRVLCVCLCVFERVTVVRIDYGDHFCVGEGVPSHECNLRPFEKIGGAPKRWAGGNSSLGGVGLCTPHRAPSTGSGPTCYRNFSPTFSKIDRAPGSRFRSTAQSTTSEVSHIAARLLLPDTPQPFPSAQERQFCHQVSAALVPSHSRPQSPPTELLHPSTNFSR